MTETIMTNSLRVTKACGVVWAGGKITYFTHARLSASCNPVCRCPRAEAMRISDDCIDPSLLTSVWSEYGGGRGV